MHEQHVGVGSSLRGLLNVAEWRWMSRHCGVSLKMGSRASVRDSCVWWNEV